MKSGEKWAVNRWVQRLDSAVKNFWMARDVGHQRDIEARFSEFSCGASSGHKFKPQLGQARCKLNDSGFVPDA